MSYGFNRGQDGNTQRINCGNLTIPQLAGTISIWYYPFNSQADGFSEWIFGIRSGATDLFQLVKFSDNALYAGWYTSSVEYELSVANGDYTLPGQTWSLFILTWDDTTNETKLYLNGTLIGQYTTGLATWNTTSKPLIIGNELGSDEVSFRGCCHGYLSDVAIFDRVVSASERTTLLTQYPTSLTPVGTHAWSLRNTLVDSWGLNDGTAVGAAPANENPTLTNPSTSTFKRLGLLGVG